MSSKWRKALMRLPICAKTPAFFISMWCSPAGRSLRKANAPYWPRLQKCRTRRWAAAELDKAKNQLVTNELRQRETSNGKALSLGEAAVLFGDPNRVNTDLNLLQKVSAADVQRVMKKYFTAANRLVIYYLPKAEQSTSSLRSQAHRAECGNGRARTMRINRLVMSQ